MKRIICALFSFSLLGIMCVCYCVDSNVVKENLNFSKTQETYDMLSFPAIPECISLSENKYIGISFNEGSQKKIIILAPYGNYATYQFHTEGSFAIELTEKEILIYLVRSQLKVSYDFDGNLNYIDDTLKGQVATKYQELTKQDKVFKGNSVLEVEANAFSYKLLLDGQIILNCSTFAIIGSKISLLPFLLVFIIFTAIFFKKTRNKKGESSTA